MLTIRRSIPFSNALDAEFAPEVLVHNLSEALEYVGKGAKLKQVISGYWHISQNGKVTHFVKDSELFGKITPPSDYLSILPSSAIENPDEDIWGLSMNYNCREIDDAVQEYLDKYK